VPSKTKLCFFIVVPLVLVSVIFIIVFFRVRSSSNTEITNGNPVAAKQDKQPATSLLIDESKYEEDLSVVTESVTQETQISESDEERFIRLLYNESLHVINDYISKKDYLSGYILLEEYLFQNPEENMAQELKSQLEQLVPDEIMNFKQRINPGKLATLSRSIRERNKGNLLMAKALLESMEGIPGDVNRRKLIDDCVKRMQDFEYMQSYLNDPPYPAPPEYLNFPDLP